MKKLLKIITLITVLIFLTVKSFLIVNPSIIQLFYKEHLNVVNKIILAASEDKVDVALSYCVNDRFEAIFEKGVLKHWTNSNDYKIVKLENYFRQKEVYIYVNSVSEIGEEYELIFILQRKDGKILLDELLF